MLGLAGAVLAGCAGKHEQLAKCSAEENPVLALGFVAEPATSAADKALSGAVKDDCGPMRPVNNLQDDTWIPSATR